MNVIEFLRFLYSYSRVLSLRELSFLTALSDRTIRTIIAEANDQRMTLGCRVDLIRSVGYQLVIEEQALFLANVLLKKEYSLKSIEHDILLELIQKSYIKIDDLCHHYYVSKGTVNKTVKHLKDTLTKYDLQILSKPYLGLYLVGAEQQKRKLMVDTGIYIESNPHYSTVLKEVFDSYEIQYNENIIQYLSHHLGLMVIRKDKCLEAIDEKQLPVLALNTAQAIFEKIKDLKPINAVEVHYFANLLTMTVIILKDQSESSVRDMVSQFNQRMIEKYQLDMTCNHLLYERFLNHLIYLQKRVRHQHQYTNIGFEYFRLISSFGYELGLEFIRYFFKDQELYVEEVGMLGLYFCLFLQNADIQYYHKNRKIAIAVPRHDLTAELFISLFKYEQSDEILSFYTFNEKDKIRAFDPDVIFTFEPFELDHYVVVVADLPIFQICDNGFVKKMPIHSNKENYLQRKRNFELLRDVSVYFSPEHYFVQKKIKDKDQLFQFLYTHLTAAQIIDQPLKSIEERLKMGAITKVGSLALLCPLEGYAKESRIIFISLNGGIVLGEGLPVHIFVMVLYKDDKDKKTMLLLLPEIFDTLEHTMDIYEQADYQSFIQYLENR